MNLKKKRRLTYFTISAFFFLGGVEYAVILPTAWLYLKNRFQAEPISLGLLLSAFSFSGLIASPIIGKISDRSQNTKAVLLVANFFEIIGSIMYFLGISTWFLIGSRLIAGIGTGVGAALFADIARATAKEKRTGVMSIIMATRQLGLVLGPGCNLFLRHLDFRLGAFPLDKFTSPGLFMALLWLIHEVLVLFLFWDLPRLRLQEDLQNAQEAYHQSVSQEAQSISAPGLDPRSGSGATPIVQRKASVPPKASSNPRPTPSAMINPAEIDTDHLTSSNEMIETVERYMGIQPGTSSSHASSRRYDDINSFNAALRRDADSSPIHGDDYYGSLDDQTTEEIPNSSSVNNPDISSSLTDSGGRLTVIRYYYNEFVKEEVVVILATVFVVNFNQLALETMVTPITEALLDWDEQENSIFYCAAGTEIILTFILIRFLSKYLEDRTLLVSGLIIECLTVAFFVWFLPQCHQHDPQHNLPGFIIGCFVHIFGLPFVAASSVSLYSKVTHEETQGFAQGIRRVFVGLGTIMGPMWAGSLVSQHLQAMLGVMLTLNAVAALMFLFSFKRLRAPQVELSSSHVRSPAGSLANSDERQHLLS